MRILFDGSSLLTYPFGQSAPMTGATEAYAKRVISGLAEKGHQVHVVAPDLETDEQRGPNEWWWGPGNHPMRADAVILIHNLANVVGYTAEHFLLMPNGVDPWLGPDQSWGERLSAVACYSDWMADELVRQRPSVPREKCIQTGLGVNVDDYYDWDHLFGKGEFIDSMKHFHGRMLYANDPARGLWHTLAIFDRVREQIPGATLHVAYDFDRQFEPWRWQQNDMAELMWRCKERLERGDGVVNLGQLSHAEILREQMECHVHCMPSDPQNVGTQTHGLTQMELAAAGVPLVLSSIEAFPELFGECATLLPLPGQMAAYDQQEDALARVTVDDWASEVINLMEDSDRWQEASRKGRELASTQSWSNVVDRWDDMLRGLE